MQIKRKAWKTLKPIGHNSLQLRLTAGITTIALLSIGSIGSWTTWQMRKMLVVDHQREIQQVAEHLERQLTTSRPTQWQSIIDQWATPNLWVAVEQPDGTLVHAGRPISPDHQSLSSQAAVMADAMSDDVADDMPDPSGVRMADEIARKMVQKIAAKTAPGTASAAVQLINGRQLVCTQQLLQPAGRPVGELYLARDITHDYGVLSTLVNQLLFGTVLALLPIAALMAVYIRQVLSPLRRMNQLAQAQATHGATHRPQAPISLEVPREVAGLVQVMSSLSARLSETGEKQRDFTNSLSHELRTSFCLVQGYLNSTLRRGQNLTPAQKEALEVAASEVDRMVELLQDLLDLGRSYGGERVDLKPVVLNDLVESVRQAVDPQGERQIELEADRLVVAKADLQLLHRVLVHLIKNAMQFSQPDQPIQIGLAQSADLAIIQVRDQGCGIAAADQARLFEPFYRVEQSRCRATGGMGLGLAIVKSLVEDMGGQVSLVSQPGAGSQFTVELQAERADSTLPRPDLSLNIP